MPRRHFSSISLYSFRLALALLLVFNGLLLSGKSYRQSLYNYELGDSVQSVDLIAGQQPLLYCQQASQRKDSRIGSPTDSPVGAGFQRFFGSGGHGSSSSSN